MNERTNTPFKRCSSRLSIVPLIIPGILFTVAWILLGSPKIGLINLALRASSRPTRLFINVYSLGGMVWVDGLHYSPMAFLLMTAAFRAIEPALWESAVMSGASVSQSGVSKVTLPLVLAGDLRHHADPLRARASNRSRCPRSSACRSASRCSPRRSTRRCICYPSQVGLASAYAVILLVITSMGVYFQSRLSTPRRASTRR